MSRRFRGSDTFKVDGKGRVSIPAQFRRVLEAGDPDWTEGLNPTLVIVAGDEDQPYLDCYTVEAMAEIDAKISRMPRFSEARDYLEDHFNGTSVETSVDETGRLVLPAKLRGKIGLKDAAFFMAKGDRFEIWHPDTHAQARKSKRAAFLDSLPEGFNPLQLLDQQEG